MATYFTDDFADFTACSGADCGDWTKRIRDDLTWDLPSGGDITIPPAAVNDWLALSWDDLDGDADRDDIEILFLVTTASSVGNTYIAILRGSGGDETTTGYIVYYNATALRTFVANGSDSSTQIATTAKTLNASTDYWIRFRVNGTSIQAKIWADGGSEPGSWDLESTNSVVSAAGWNGFSRFGALNDGTVVKQVGFGTNGDTAPASGGGGAQALTPSLYTGSQSFYAPTVSLGAVVLTPALFSNSQAFYAPAVTPGAVALIPSLVTNGQTFYAAAVEVDGGPQTLLPSLVANTSTFYAASLSSGAVTLTPDLFANTSTFFAPAVSQGFAGQALTPALVVNTSQFFTAIVTTGGVTLTPSLLTNTSTFYAHLIAGGLVTTAKADAIFTVVPDQRIFTVAPERRIFSS